MNRALIHGTQNDPLDHSIEAALPGVHSRLVANRDEIVAMRTDLAEFRDEQNKKLDDIQGTTNEQTLELAGTLRALSDSITGKDLGIVRSVRGDNSDEKSVNRCSQYPFPSPEDRDDLFEKCVGYHVYQRHSSLQSAIDEWLGEGKWEDHPIPGGVAEAEEKYKAKWRRDYKLAERKYFS